MTKTNDLYFRFHRGSLADSLTTEIHGTKEEIIDYIQKDFADWGGVSDLQCEFYGHDSRIKRYHDTYLVTGVYVDGKRSPIGFASGSLFQQNSTYMGKNNDLRYRIGSMIATRRTELGFSVRGLSELCGVSYQNITKIEHGKYNVSIDILGKIADALEVEIVISPKCEECK